MSAKKKTAEVVLAEPADEETVEKIKAFVRSRGYDGAEFSYDPAIGGGIIVYFEDRVYDGSVRGRLNAVRRSI